MLFLQFVRPACKINICFVIHRHYWRSVRDEDQDFEITVSVQKYVKAVLEAFVCVMDSSAVHADGGLLQLDANTTCCSTSSSLSSSTSCSFQVLAKECVSVKDTDDCIEVQLFVPAVAFADTVERYIY